MAIAAKETSTPFESQWERAAEAQLQRLTSIKEAQNDVKQCKRWV